MTSLLKLLLLCIAVSCPIYAWGDIQRVEDDKFSPDVAIYGGIEYVNPFGDIARHWFIRSWVNKKTGIARHQLYVEIRSPGGFSGFNVARDDHADDLEVRHLGLLSGSAETLGIALPAGILSERSVGGYPIKLSARNGNNFVLMISPAQIRSQLAALELYRPASPERGAVIPDSATLPLAGMVPSIGNPGSAALLKSVEPAATAVAPSLGVLAIGCTSGRLIVSVGTEFSIKKIWSIGPTLTDVRYYIDADDSHRNWARYNEREAGPQSFVSSFVNSLSSAKELRVAFNVDGIQDRRSVTFDLVNAEFASQLASLLTVCR